MISASRPRRGADIGNGTGRRDFAIFSRYRSGVQLASFGERMAAYDSFYGQDIERWRATGVFTRVDLAFSRDQDERVGVQHVIRLRQRVCSTGAR